LPGQPAQQANAQTLPGQAAQQANAPTLPGQPAQQANAPTLPGQAAQQANAQTLPGQPAQQANAQTLPDQATQQANAPTLPGQPAPQANPQTLPGQPAQTANPQALPGQAAQQANLQTLPGQAAQQANPQTLPGQPAQQANPQTFPGQPAQQANPPTLPGQPVPNPAAWQGAGTSAPFAAQIPTNSQGYWQPENAAAAPIFQNQAAAGGQESSAVLPQKEIAQILKGNLLPLLGEIVVKYNQNGKIRDHVMVAVHNTVRVDQGTPEAVRAAISKLVRELRQVANLPEDFPRNLTDAIFQNSREAKQADNRVMEKLVDVINEALRSEQSSPAAIRQAETLLLSLLQNQSAIMDVLHYVVPIQMNGEQMIAELYIDPDSDNGGGKTEGKSSRKVFLAFETKAHGAFELSFLQTGDRVDFSMWCPGVLVGGLSGMKRYFSTVMQAHGYTMNSFTIDEYKRPQSVAEVFPNLLNRRVGIDVRV
jgi:hypothetical protein